MVRKQAFTHDYGARNDMRLISVRMHLGMAGIGINRSLMQIPLWHVPKRG